MKRDRKIQAQDTGKEENRVVNIRPGSGQANDTADVGISPQMQGEALNQGNQVTADIVVNDAEGDTGNTDAFHNNNTENNYAQEVDVNRGQVGLDQSPGATNIGNNPSNTDVATALNDREAISRSVDEDAQKQTGRPTGAIYGSGGDIMSVTNSVDQTLTSPKKDSSNKKASSKKETSLTKIYGQLQAEDSSFFIHQGNVPQGQLQLLAGQEVRDQMNGYTGQWVSIAGKLSKKNKGDTYATFSIQNIVSHEQIGSRAYELSHQNSSSEEDNWVKAENELLQL
jgi:hypothetical protein